MVEEKSGAFSFCVAACSKMKTGGALEPWSSQTRSPSPPSSTSTLSSLGGGGAGSSDTAGAAVVSANWNSTSTAAAESLDDWKTILSEFAAFPGQDQSFGIIDPAFGFAPISFASLASSGELSQIGGDGSKNQHSSQLIQPPCVKNPNLYPLEIGATSPPPPPPSSPPGMFFQEAILEKSQLFGPNIIFNQHHQTVDSPNPAIFSPFPSFTPSQHQQQQQIVVDMLLKAAQFVEAGNFVGAQLILARLNHYLPSPIGKPLIRSAFYLKGALQLLLNSVNPQSAAASSPFDAVLKLSACKAFSEVSPILPFTCFTATQALVEELAAANCIHIIDFGISSGAQWSSFLQELARRRSPRILLVKITVFVSPPASHPLELHLIKESLCRFAADLNIPFEIRFSNIDAFDPAEILILSAGNSEAIAVNLPVEACQGASFPTLLRLVKQLLPKIVITADHGFDRSDLPFSHHFLHALQSCVVLLDSIDEAGTNLDVVNKIEKFVLQPKIEKCIIGHRRAAEKTLPWPTQFKSAGFEPLQLSNFAEMQAECLLQRLQVSGFQVEKREASIYLHWQGRELASVSVWKS